jgi:predicted cobalt transporter CbtA
VIAAIQTLLPDVNEVPEDFPAVVLWRFRESSLGLHIVLWSAIGLLFGWLIERRFVGSRRR